MSVTAPIRKPTQPMSFGAIFRLPLVAFLRHRIAVSVMLLAIVASALYPTDLSRYPVAERLGENGYVIFTEHYGRHATTIAALLVPLITRDVTGVRQVLVVALVGMLATHGPKRLLDNVVIFGTRLGERPLGPACHHNMPSGHSALASAAALFLARRYGRWWLIMGLPWTLLTMFARVALNAHTISAVMAGGLIGCLVALLFTTARGERPVVAFPAARLRLWFAGMALAMQDWVRLRARRSGRA